MTKAIPVWGRLLLSLLIANAEIVALFSIMSGPPTLLRVLAYLNSFVVVAFFMTLVWRRPAR